MLDRSRTRKRKASLFRHFALPLWVAISVLRVTSQTPPGSPAPSLSAAEVNDSAAPGHAAATFRSRTREVVVDLVALDKQKRPVRDLAAQDIRVFERTGWTAKSEQKLVAFRLVDKTDSGADAADSRPILRIPPGTHTNILATRELQDPPTILLLDNLNSNLWDADNRNQIVQMIDSVSKTSYDVPIAVLLLSDRLHLLQDFTTDMSQVRTAVKKLFSHGPFGDFDMTVIQGPSSSVQKQAGVFLPAPWSPVVKEWDRVSDNGYTDRRIQMTIDAFRALARHFSGYPGRKKLVWISSGFPFSTVPSDRSDSGRDSAESHEEQIGIAANALSRARIAVYTMQLGGVWMPDVFTASRKDRPQPQSPKSPQFAVGDELLRQDAEYHAAQASMAEIAIRTGGQECNGGNDLSDCLKKALADGYTYYELAYVPPAEMWKQGFHHIVVESSKRGVRLYYRRGYYVSKEDLPQQGNGDNRASSDRELKQAACDDVMTATAVPITVEALSSDESGTAGYLLKVDGRYQANTPARRPGRLEFGVCTFDAAGRALQYLQFPSIQDSHPETSEAPPDNKAILRFHPDPHLTQLRWIVRDEETGELGSLDLPFDRMYSVGIPSGTFHKQVTAVQGALPFASPEQPQAAPEPGSMNLEGAKPPSPKPEPRLDTLAEIHSYCEDAGSSEPNAEALAKVCDYALTLRTKLPNLLCDRRTTRYWRSWGAHQKEEVKTEVAYRDGTEYDRDASPGPGSHYGFMRIGASSSGGEFSAYLPAIFSWSADALFEFRGEESLGSSPALVFDYTVERQNNRTYYLHAIYLGGGSKYTFPGYKGRIWVNKSTLQILRLERHTSDIEDSFPITYASTIIDYKEVGLGDGTSFVLPVYADLVSCSESEGKECAHNILHYENYRKFRATTRIVTEGSTSH